MASSESREFLSSLGMHANELGGFTRSPMRCCSSPGRVEKPGFKLALIVSMGLVVFALVLTFSRGLLGFALINVLFLLWRRKREDPHSCSGSWGVRPARAARRRIRPHYDRVRTRRGRRFGRGQCGSDQYICGRFPRDTAQSIYGHGLGRFSGSDPMRRGAGVTILAGDTLTMRTWRAARHGIVGLVLLCAYFAHVCEGFRALSADPPWPDPAGFYLGRRPDWRAC